jgi:cell division protein FtsN/nucleoid DNA-binding protein
MIIGKYIKRLLEDRTRVILPGFGNLQMIPPDGTIAASGKRLDPPGVRIKFDAGFSKDDGLLAETVAAGEMMEREEAHQQVLELVDAIKFALDKGEDFQLPEAGAFSRDADGKIHFRTDPSWVLEPDQYGLESMDLLELEELPIEEVSTQNAGAESKSSSELTKLAPPKAKPKSIGWRVIWLVAGILIVVLVVLIVIPTEGPGDSGRKGLFKRQPDREEVEQTDVSPEVSPDASEGVSEDQVPDLDQGQTEEQAVEPEIPQEEVAEEAEQDQPPEEGKNFLIIAGSFSKLKNASDLQDQLNSRGFNAEVMITENRMYRVIVASFATKEEAEKALSQIKTESGLESSWLLSN